MTTATTDSTKRVIAEMLTESTGTHMLDSGGSMGRSWQRNQAEVGDSDPVAIFDSHPESEFGWPAVYPHPNHREGKDPSIFRAELWLKHDVFHWLSQAVEFNSDVDTLFTEYAELPENADEHWLSLMESFPEWHAKRAAAKLCEDEARDWNDSREEDEAELTAEEVAEMHGIEVKAVGIYGDGEPVIVNTYNGEDALSQTIQYVYYELRNDGGANLGDGEGFVLLQIHQGADVRGGYTRPRAFNAWIESDPPGLFDNARGGVFCDNCHTGWQTDDAGARWHSGWCGSEHPAHAALEQCSYSDNGPSYPVIPDLDELSAIEGDAVTAAFHSARMARVLGEQPTIVIEQTDQYPSNGGARVYCPICGIGTLHPALY